ncbi:hypothetical protein RvY_09309 [Ramazzottius varieornatus]|uniref:Uncharacterized protein n=1 Tax=Ramazzottius varieornatus TaxID=947166 RepID=A0A1D1V8Y4_RAMVA|nr:hypothetical protein RvY_09309 [Ramazzottius varieornatus]
MFSFSERVRWSISSVIFSCLPISADTTTSISLFILPGDSKSSLRFASVKLSRSVTLFGETASLAQISQYPFRKCLRDIRILS